MSLQLLITFQEPLAGATYQELTAHLEQLPTLTVTPTRRSSASFEYLASPIDHLRLDWGSPQNQGQMQLLLTILGHYGRFTIASPAQTD